MPDPTTVKVYFLTSVEIPIDLVPETDNEAICEALIHLTVPPDTTLIGYDVARPGTREAFYWDADFQSILEQGIFGPVFSITASLEALKDQLQDR